MNLPEIPTIIALDMATIQQKAKQLMIEADKVFLDSAIPQSEFNEWVRNLNRWAEACHSAKF